MNRSILKFLAIFFTASIVLTSCSDSSNNDTPTGENVLSGSITANKTLTSDVIWELAGKVVVESGVTLKIEPGTIIKGRQGKGSLASALVIARGAKIDAQGTADNPIIMTSILDNIAVGEKIGTNLTEQDREKWGGLVILGKAPISAGDGDTEAQIEGIPANETFGKYGGNDPGDDSGILKYISVRHGGALIGEGNEINGITLGGVGSKTVIDHVEIVANLDDGIECFGGTVNITNAIVAYQGDDAFDIDQNFAGSFTNVVAIHGIDTDNALEIDGPEGSTNTNGLFTVTKGTFHSTDGVGRGATLKDKAQGTISDCVFMGYSDTDKKWIRVRASFDEDNNCAAKTDAYTHMTNSPATLTLSNNQFDSGLSLAEIANVYQDDSCTSKLTQTYQDNVDAAVAGGSNSIGSSGGADMSEFTGWTWTDLKGKL